MIFGIYKTLLISFLNILLLKQEGKVGRSINEFLREKNDERLELSDFLLLQGR